MVQILLVVFTGPQLWASDNYSMKDFEKFPISIISESVTPQVMIAASNDHQLYYAAYNDYTDLDDDGIAETTYDNDIDYYGYFDSYKCYTYSTTNLRFEPEQTTTDKYCNASYTKTITKKNGKTVTKTVTVSDQWSGNFLNWATMARIDTIRKILFGGHRRVDSSTETVLERTYLPHDAHSWAKYYDGDDLSQLTPLTSDTGITLCNTTDVDMDNYSSSQFSEDFSEPPLLKVVKGNYSLWASNERWQCTWSSGADYDNHSASNSNDSSESGIDAASSSPAYTDEDNQGDYVVRVEVCVDGLIGEENCKLYPGADSSSDDDDVYKPIGLLQSYGDDGDMEFGMVAGSYGKHASGGVLVRNVGPISDEINVDTDGTFSKVSIHASDNGVDDSEAEGLINAWSLYRIVGYDGDNGYYNNGSGDNCPWGLSSVSNQTGERCKNWVNPFSEIYYQAVNYFAGNGIIDDYNDSGTTYIDGLPDPPSYSDPLDDENYCADLFIINLSTSNPSYDYDELDDSTYKPSTVWDSDDLPDDGSSSALTDVIGDNEDITGNSYFIGEVNLGTSSSDEDYQLCTAKTVSSFGDAGGICPEEPRLGGSYRVAGLAYYAHTKDLRPDSDEDRGIEGDQTIDTYSIALSPGTPVIEVPDPEDTSADALVTILPACRNQSLDPQGNCALVSFKIVSQEVDSDNNTASGKFYINWEDSEMGGDHDQDMWGTLSYSLSAEQKLTITTEVHAQSTGYKMAFGYVISGTEDDGFHAHSGINGYTHTETVAVDDGSSDCQEDTGGCYHNDEEEPSSKTYTLGTSDASLLYDPLWYASKYGGFSDSNDNNLPDLTSEWDEEDNSTGESGADGIPDNYFYASNPEDIETALSSVLSAILDRASSGTAAATVSANVDGEGAQFIAYYDPSKTSAEDSSVEGSWIGTLTALWLDDSGNSRQDCTPPDDEAVNDDGECETLDLDTCVPNGQLDSYCVDQVVESFYNDDDGTTQVHIYQSNDPDSFTAYSMQGVVTEYDDGTVTLQANSMEGLAEYSSDTLTISPYELNGTVTAWDSTTGEATITITDGDWTGPDDETFDTWTVTSNESGGTGSSTSSITFAAGSATLTVSPVGTWISTGDTLTLQSKNLVGNSGDSFEDWTISCLDGADATGSISSSSLELSNAESTSATITTEDGDFTDCDRARFSTFDLVGTEGEEYSSWEVTDLDNSETDGTSSSTMTLANSGTLTFEVSPTTDWISTGDRIQIASNTTTTVDLDEVSYLWNAREELYLSDLDDNDIAFNRDYTSQTADQGRYIMTWIDDDLDGVVDDNEYRDFDEDMFDNATLPVSYTFFDVASETVAKELVEYIRGIEKTDSRNRTIQYSSSDTDSHVMRLGDIVNSTPTAVSYPQEAFDLLYNDSTYSEFKQQYIDRRTVVYVGANDGMIHAFNGGFYTETTDDDGETIVSYSTSGTTYDGSDAVEHPLGSELWAYIPFNLFPHLQWLKDEDYADSHVTYIDGKPKIFEAKIFDTDDDHPGGWGTVMVVGMNLGGGAMEVDVTNSDDETESHTFRSAYVVMDITNPEVAPTLLGEIPPPDESFTTVYPAVAAFQDIDDDTTCDDGNSTCNSWYLVFGTGPNDLSSVESSQSTKVYLFDLKQLIDGAKSPDTLVTSDTCDVEELNSSYNIISCDTGIGNTFMGTPVVVDWDLDFMANTLYFGLVRDEDTTSNNSDGTDTGRVMRMAFSDNADYSTWSAPITFFNADEPISIYDQPVTGIDDDGNHWVFFGSGRYFSMADKSTTYIQSLFGVKDLEDDNYPITKSYDLLDVSDAEVYTDGSLQTDIIALDGTSLSTFDEIEEEIEDNASGWYRDLPAIIGETGVDPATRNVTKSLLVSGVLASTVFQPSLDACEGEGNSRLYALYYKTGTGYPDSSILVTSSEDDDGTTKYLTTTYVNLGTGFASAPTASSGSGSDTVTIYSKMSTSATIQTDINTTETIRSGRISWTDLDSDD